MSNTKRMPTNIKMTASDTDILKESLMRGLPELLAQEGDDDDKKAEKPVPVPKTIGGIVNLGKTYFWKQDEIKLKDEWVQAQMVQKYGAEIYGSSAQLNGSNGNASSLISCKVSQFVDLTHVKKESGEESTNKKFNAFKKKLEDVYKFLDGKNKDEAWKKEHAIKGIDMASIGGIVKEFKDDAVPGKESTAAWEKLFKTLTTEPLKTALSNVKEWKTTWQALSTSWNNWKGKVDDASGGKDNGKDHLQGGAQGLSGDGWQPTMSLRIDVQTKFDDDWFKRKFKSGFLNKMIFTIKTGVMSKSSKSEYTQDNEKIGHKYTADEMLPEDKRKLDSLQWKMTNKVAKDYISMLLGWSRSKVLKYDETGNKVPVDVELQPDKGFGSQMAKKALSNRGILGRLKQKIFAGGQASNAITVAFQMADPNDGWTLEEKNDSGTSAGSDIPPPEDGEKKGGEDAEPTSESTKMKLLRELCASPSQESVDALITNCLLKEG